MFLLHNFKFTSDVALFKFKISSLFFQWSQQPNVPTLGHEMRGVRLTCNRMSWLGVCHYEVILGASDPLWKAFFP